MYHDGNSKVMVEYGFIENGYLRVKALEPATFQERNPETGEIKTKVITVEDQIMDLPPGWKPLEKIDEDRMVAAQSGYIVSAIPYDAGETISYRYEMVPDLQRMRRKLAELKDQLTASDYQIIKCYEASLIGDQLPYDVKALHASRQSIRDQINSLEAIMAEIGNQL